MDPNIRKRLDTAKAICSVTGDNALKYFERLELLSVERKGHQDLVSEADRNVELQIREKLAEVFPEALSCVDVYGPRLIATFFLGWIDNHDC